MGSGGVLVLWDMCEFVVYKRLNDVGTCDSVLSYNNQKAVNILYTYFPNSCSIKTQPTKTAKGIVRTLAIDVEPRCS